MDGSRCCTHRIIKGTRPKPVCTFFLLSPFLLIYVFFFTQLHTDIETPKQSSGAGTQTAESTKKDGCSTKAIGGTCCSIASTVKNPCSNEFSNLPSATLSSCAEGPCSNESTYLTTLPSTCCEKSASPSSNESNKLSPTALPSTCCAK